MQGWAEGRGVVFVHVLSGAKTPKPQAALASILRHQLNASSIALRPCARAPFDFATILDHDTKSLRLPQVSLNLNLETLNPKPIETPGPEP